MVLDSRQRTHALSDLEIMRLFCTHPGSVGTPQCGATTFGRKIVPSQHRKVDVREAEGGTSHLGVIAGIFRIGVLRFQLPYAIDDYKSLTAAN